MGVHIVYASGFLRIESLEDQPHATLDQREQGHGPEGDDANNVQR